MASVVGRNANRESFTRTRGQWLWRSWQSSRFQYQRTQVRIQSLATFIEHLFTVCRKDENKEKEAENGPFLKNKRGIRRVGSML